ncbi:MAG: YebC/PmpR family DNA-binding transcriptional regulator [Parcubacteria group bacterium]|nr:YebC/PmpR family DNA-binding transcriptional regulator [Parcubacteria group bacterium]
MSGHSKWSQIKHKKAITDGKKSKIFSKVSALISIAVKEKKDPSPATNPKLALAIEKAKSINMPQDNIKRAIERGKGVGAGEELERLRYEAYGPYGVAFIIDAVSDNKNRTLAEVKHILSQHNGKFAAMGSVSWMFEERGEIEFDTPSIGEEQELELIESGALDIEKGETGVYISCSLTSLESLKTKCNDLRLSFSRAESLFIPKETIVLDEKQKQEILTLLDALDEQNEVDEVYTNAEL